MAPLIRARRAIARYLRGIRDLLRPEVTIMRGRLKLRGDTLAICYAGAQPRGYRLGFPSQVFASLTGEQSLGRCWAWQLRRVAAAHGCAFILAEWSSHRPLGLAVPGSANSFRLLLPFYVHTVVDLLDLDTLLNGNKNLRNDIRKARNAGYVLEISSDVEDYRSFLSDYHEPYLRQVHGNLASHFDYTFLCRPDFADHPQWELLKLMRNDQWVAGLLVRKAGNIAYSHEVGLAPGIDLREGRDASAALYWFFTRRMAQLGFGRGSFMWSPPFLDNGVLAFKGKYRPRLEAAPSTRQGLLLVEVARCAATREILASHAFVSLSGSDLVARRFVNRAADVASARESLARDCARFSGIARQEVGLLGL
jgi:hypothetical protein